MSQTRKQSMIEAWTNVIVGWGVGLLSQVLIFPLFGILVPVSSNIKISFWFTLVSLARSYALRRYYNWRHRR